MPDFLGPLLPLHISKKHNTWRSLRMLASVGPQGHHEARRAPQAVLWWQGEQEHLANPFVLHPSLLISAALPPAEMLLLSGWPSRSLLLHGHNTWCFILFSFLSSLLIHLTFCHFTGSKSSGCILSVGLRHQWILLPVTPSCCLISLWVQVQKWAVPLGQSCHASCMSMLFGMNAPPLLHRWGCHICREFGKVACIYTGIYLNQIERLSSTACAEYAGIKSQAFSVTLSTVTIFNANALAENRCCSVNGRLRFRLVPMK